MRTAQIHAMPRHATPQSVVSELSIAANTVDLVTSIEKAVQVQMKVAEVDDS